MAETSTILESNDPSIKINTLKIHKLEKKEKDKYIIILKPTSQAVKCDCKGTKARGMDCHVIIHLIHEHLLKAFLSEAMEEVPRLCLVL